MIKEVIFGIWGSLWVAIDRLVKKLEAMSTKEFFKFIGTLALYSISILGWIAIIFGFCIVGWAAL